MIKIAHLIRLSKLINVSKNKVKKPPISPDSKYGYHVVKFWYMYRYYVKSRKGQEVLKSKVYHRAFEKVMEKIWEKLIKESWICQLPKGFGQVYIYEEQRAGNKMTKYIDWVETKKRGEHVYRYNKHSNGIRHKLCWDRVLCNVAHNNRYTLSFLKGSSDDIVGRRGITYWVNECNENPMLPIYRSNIREYRL